MKENMTNDSHSYRTGWRPEPSLADGASDMLAIIFDQTSTTDECEMAATTLMDVVHPEILRKATEGLQNEFDFFIGAVSTDDLIAELNRRLDMMESDSNRRALLVKVHNDFCDGCLVE